MSSKKSKDTEPASQSVTQVPQEHSKSKRAEKSTDNPIGTIVKSQPSKPDTEPASQSVTQVPQEHSKSKGAEKSTDNPIGAIVKRQPSKPDSQPLKTKAEKGAAAPLEPRGQCSKRKGSEKKTETTTGGQQKIKKTEAEKGQRRRKRAEPRVDTGHQTTLSDYFPVRRSTRRCKSHIENEKYEGISSKLRTKCEDNLEVIKDEVKGRGVITTVPRVKGDFVCEYSGELISFEKAQKKEADYSKDSDVGCYMYYFQHKNTKYCVDATVDNGRMGRLLNHSRTEANVSTKLHEVDGQPYLCLMAARSISVGEELLYDYGERSKEVIQSHPWLQS